MNRYAQKSENVWTGKPINKDAQAKSLHPKSNSRGLFPTLNRSTHVPQENPLADKMLSDVTKQEHRMGTSIMSIVYDGGVVMGADTRTSLGTYVANRVSDKIVPVSDNIYCCRCGSAADTQAVAAIVRYNLGVHSIELNAKPLVQTAANVFSSLLYKNKGSLSAGIICAGWDEQNGGSVYSVPGGGSLLKVPLTFMGSGSTYIYALADANYRENMTKEEAKKFVKNGISHAMARDGSSGGCIRLIVISKDGVEREFVPGNKVPSWDP